MGFLSTLAITAVIGVFIVLVIALISYVSNLVKQAYELKVELRRELNEGLSNLEEEINKRSRWVKRELLTEIEKIRANHETLIESRTKQIADSNNDTLKASEEQARQDRASLDHEIQENRRRLKALDKDLKQVVQTVNILQALTPGTPEEVEAETAENAEQAAGQTGSEPAAETEAGPAPEESTAAREE